MVRRRREEKRERGKGEVKRTTGGKAKGLGQEG
jgi:hypothetical protein